MSAALLLSDDFLFISRVQGHARALGLEVRPVRTPEALLQKVGEAKPGCVLLDLHVDGLEIVSLVAGLKQGEPAPFVVGYGSHVDVATLRRARDAGCDLVLPRSKFVEDLPNELPKWIATPRA